MVSLSLYFKWDWALCILLLKDPREKGHTERQGRNQTENSHRKSVKRFTVLWLPAVCCPLWTCSADWREHMAIPVHPWKAMQCSLNHLPLQIKLSHQTLSWCGWGVFTRVIPQGVILGERCDTALALTHLLNINLNLALLLYWTRGVSPPHIGYIGEWDRR